MITFQLQPQPFNSTCCKKSTRMIYFEIPQVIIYLNTDLRIEKEQCIIIYVICCRFFILELNVQNHLYKTLLNLFPVKKVLEKISFTSQIMKCH